MSRTLRGMLAMIAVLAATAAAATAVDTPPDDESLDRVKARLGLRYPEFATTHDSGLPFEVRAVRDDGVSRSRAEFLLPGASLEAFAAVLATPGGWCEALMLHLNVKGCLPHDAPSPQVELFLGRKYYETPSEAARIVFRFDSADGDGVARRVLKADDGPYGSSGYRFVLNAIGVADGVFVELFLSTVEGYAGRLVSLYLNTVGRSKVGFTRVDEPGEEADYIRGPEAAAERNVVRYMFALQVTLRSAGAPFMARAAKWFDATERYPTQLRELERDRYLAIKQREYEGYREMLDAADEGAVIETLMPRKER